MKNVEKKERNKNDLEAWIIDKYTWCKENQDKVSRFVLFCLIVCFVIVGIRWYMGRNNSALQNRMDDAYYMSTSKSLFSGAGAPDPVPFEQMIVSSKRGEEAMVLRLSAAEAYLKTGRSEVEQKYAQSAGNQGNPDSIVRTSVQPEAAFNKALDRFDEVVKKASGRGANDLKARALYGSGMAMEYMASVAGNEDAVTQNLDKAVSYYKSAVASHSTSPFADAAQQRIDRLTQPITVAYYKQLSDKFTHLPEAPAKTESILPTGTDAPLSPGDDTSATSEFQLTEESAPAEEAAPAAEAVPTEEAGK